MHSKCNFPAFSEHNVNWLLLVKLHTNANFVFVCVCICPYGHRTIIVHYHTSSALNRAALFAVIISAFMGDPNKWRVGGGGTPAAARVQLMDTRAARVPWFQWICTENMPTTPQGPPPPTRTNGGSNVLRAGRIVWTGNNCGGELRWPHHKDHVRARLCVHVCVWVCTMSHHLFKLLCHE